MADAPKLTNEQKQKIADWLNTKWPGSKFCNICGHSSWIVGDHVVAPTNVTGGGVYFGGPLYPLTILTCSNCGNTHFFNSVVMGISQPDAEKTKEQDGKGGPTNAESS